MKEKKQKKSLVFKVTKLIAIGGLAMTTTGAACDKTDSQVTVNPVFDMGTVDDVRVSVNPIPNDDVGTQPDGSPDSGSGVVSDIGVTDSGDDASLGD